MKDFADLPREQQVRIAVRAMALVSKYTNPSPFTGIALFKHDVRPNIKNMDDLSNFQIYSCVDKFGFLKRPSLYQASYDIKKYAVPLDERLLNRKRNYLQDLRNDRGVKLNIKTFAKNLDPDNVPKETIDRDFRLINMMIPVPNRIILACRLVVVTKSDVEIYRAVMADRMTYRRGRTIDGYACVFQSALHNMGLIAWAEPDLHKAQRNAEKHFNEDLAAALKGTPA